MLNGGGGADSASVARVHCTWRKFKELSVILTKEVSSLKLKGKVYMTCVRSAMVYGSGAECKIGADRDDDGTMDVWCISEGY